MRSEVRDKVVFRERLEFVIPPEDLTAEAVEQIAVGPDLPVALVLPELVEAVEQLFPQILIYLLLLLSLEAVAAADGVVARALVVMEVD
jgi:hypothetical protein